MYDNVITMLIIISCQGYSYRTCVWDGDSLVLPSDSGKLVWWSQTGDRLASFAVGTSDYVVRLEWSVSGGALWMCGFSTMTCLGVKRSDEGWTEMLNKFSVYFNWRILQDLWSQ